MTFDYPGYDLKFIQRQPCTDGSAHRFTLVYKFFSPVTGYLYILRAEYHDEDVFAVKFYCKKDRRSEYKYSRLVNKGDVGNILITCLNVIPILLAEYPTASFAFAGARTFDAASKKLEPPANNQRFRTYRHIVAKKVGTATFAHRIYPAVSGYVLINRKSGDVVAKEAAIMSMLQATYNNLDDIA